MNFLPRFKECPCCGSLNLFKVNGITYENNFKSLSNWTLKKLINCRKCKIQFGLFVNNEVEKVAWIEMLECEDICSDQLIKLQNKKNKYQEKNKIKEYHKILHEIQTVQNQIRLDQIKVKIKAKIQNQNLFVRNF
jgi:hypothetical protein